MKKTLIFTALLAATAFAPSARAQDNKCSTHQHLEQLLNSDPLLQQEWDQFQSKVQQITDNNSGLKQQPSVQSVPRVIPVVFHVIHEGGAENISRAQILDQIRILNLDYSK